MGEEYDQYSSLNLLVTFKLFCFNFILECRKVYSIRLILVCVNIQCLARYFCNSPPSLLVRGKPKINFVLIIIKTSSYGPKIPGPPKYNQWEYFVHPNFRFNFKPFNLDCPDGFSPIG